MNSDKLASPNPIVGTDEHFYEVIHDWGTLPPHIRYGNTHGVCEDSQGLIYVHHTVHQDSQSSDSMVVFDPDGKFVRSWWSEFKGGAHGLQFNRENGEDYLYLCDKNRGIVAKTTTQGEHVWNIGYPEQSWAYQPNSLGATPKYSPTNLAIAPDGSIYVADGYGSSYIIHYDHQGGYIDTFGGKGSEAGKLNCPHGIIVDTRYPGDPILVVADRGNNRIQRFTLAGQHVDFIAGTYMPCHFAHHTNGDVVIPDLAARVTLLDRNNHIIVHLGDDSATDWQKTRTLTRDHFTPGKFIAPHSACFDRNGNIFVVEWVEIGRVTKLRKI